jgi:hypothetical protein
VRVFSCMKILQQQCYVCKSSSLGGGLDGALWRFIYVYEVRAASA